MAIKQVVDRIQCELYETIHDLYEVRDDRGRRKFRWIKNYTATGTLALAVNAEGGITPEIALLGPFAGGDFSFGIGGGITASASRIATYEFSIDFADAAKFHWCRREPAPGYLPLAGNLGFGEWFVNVLRSIEKSDTFQRPDKLSHRSEFVLDGNLKLTPAYTLTRSKGSSVFSIERKDTHTLDMVFVYVDPEASFDRVCVVNLPGANPDDCKKKRFIGHKKHVPDVRTNPAQDLQLRGIQLNLDKLRIR